MVVLINIGIIVKIISPAYVVMTSSHLWFKIFYYAHGKYLSRRDWLVEAIKVDTLTSYLKYENIFISYLK